MKSGVGPFREVRTGRQFLNNWRIDPNELHRYMPSLIEKDEAEFKRLELIAWKDDVSVPLCRERNVSPVEKRSDPPYNTHPSTLNITITC